MERVRARDSDAFEALYDAYHRLVYGVALRVLNDPGSAEDVTQSRVPQVVERTRIVSRGKFLWLARARDA